MGTTLTGTTPQDTYDSLIKVTDNGPLSGTAKYLSDGLGNDSKLALSTGNIGIGTTSPSTTLHLDASGGATIRLQRTSASNNRFDVGTDGTNMEFNVRDTGAFTFGGGNVGIGISSPTQALHISGTDKNILVDAGYIQLSYGSANYYTRLSTEYNFPYVDTVLRSEAGASYQGRIAFRTNSGGGATSTRAEIDNSGYLRLFGGGIQFNGDTAAANALDDYEEGTFTPTLTASTSNPTVTYAAFNTGGIYTKVGNKVTVSFEVRFTALSGGSGEVRISGLPFTRKTTTQPDGERCIIDAFGITISGKYLTGTVASNTTYVGILNINSAGAIVPMDVADLPTAALGLLRGTITYFV